MARGAPTRPSDLPPEIQGEILRHLPLEVDTLNSSRAFAPGVINDEIVRNTPRSQQERLAYYERIGYQPGITREIGDRLLDEGMSTLLLREVGRRGDSKMITFLKNHGIVNIDDALASAILHHRNDFVREWINSPISTLDPLIRAALDGDNLEMMREIASRIDIEPYMTGQIPFFHLPPNRTSFWYIYFYKDDTYVHPTGLYATGFALDIPRTRYQTYRYELFQAMLSDLIEPLPFTYDQIMANRRVPNQVLDVFVNPRDIPHLRAGTPRSHIDASFARDFANELWKGKTTNYARLEWILDFLINDGSINVESHRREWVQAFLPLVGNPLAGGVMQRCERLIGQYWLMVTGPIKSPEQITLVLGYVGRVNPTAITIRIPKFIPPQPEALRAWLDRCLNGINTVEDTDMARMNALREFDRGVIFLLYYYPGGEFSLEPDPARARTFTRVGGGPFDFRGELLRFFDARPIQVAKRILQYRLIDLWNELVSSGRLQLDPRDISGGLAELLDGASKGGLNSLFDSLQKMYPEAINDTREIGPGPAGKFPRIDLALQALDPNRPRWSGIHVRNRHEENNSRINDADAKLRENEELIAERLRFLPQ